MALAAVRSKAVVLLLLLLLFLLLLISLLISTPIVGFCNCSMFFCVRYFVSIVALLSSRWGRERWLLCIVCLP